MIEVEYWYEILKNVFGKVCHLYAKLEDMGCTIEGASKSWSEWGVESTAI